MPALYFTGPLAVDSVPVMVRWHNKIDSAGDLDGQYGTVIDGVDRLIFLEDDLTDRLVPVQLARNGEVVIPEQDNATFSLDQLDPGDGLGEIIWTVARLKGRQV